MILSAEKRIISSLGISIVESLRVPELVGVEFCLFSRTMDGWQISC